MRDDFAQAVDRVQRDIQLDQGHGADLVAIGVERGDCLELLTCLLEDEPRITPELLAVVLQIGVAVGVWIERGRWDECAT